MRINLHLSLCRKQGAVVLSVKQNKHLAINTPIVAAGTPFVTSRPDRLPPGFPNYYRAHLKRNGFPRVRSALRICLADIISTQQFSGSNCSVAENFSDE